MGNTWNYSIILGPDQIFTSDGFRRVLALSESFGFVPVFDDPERTKVYVDNGTSLNFTAVEPFEEFVCSRGGSFSVWRGRQDIVLSFKPTERRIGASVLHNLTRGRDEGIAAVLEKLFRGLCDSFAPQYGYSTGEWMLEVEFRDRDFLEAWTEFQQSVEEKRPPTLFFG